MKSFFEKCESFLSEVFHEEIVKEATSEPLPEPVRRDIFKEKIPEPQFEPISKQAQITYEPAERKVRDHCIADDPIKLEPIESDHTDQPRRPKNSIPIRPRTEDELRKSIAYKLFSSPHTHDRYTRLTAEEKSYISLYAGLSKREREVFMLKCRKNYYKYELIAIELGCSVSRVKQIAIRIDSLIRHMLEN